jgi:hypothetical protein
MQAATSRPQTFPQTPEAIEAVLSRFQEWTSSRRPTTGHGLREVSYEDAVKANRHRGPARKPRTEPMEENCLRAEPGVIPVEAPQLKPATKPRSPEQKSTAAKPSQRTKAAKQAQEKPAALARPQTAFKTILADAVAPPTQANALTKTGAVRQVTISLRMAPSEQAAIRARAAEAGLSASAYMRQCALEVDHLREQVRQTLALIGQTAALAASNQAQMQLHAPMQAPQPGFLERMKQVFFGNKQARNLSLRA